MSISRGRGPLYHPTNTRSTSRLLRFFRPERVGFSPARQARGRCRTVPLNFPGVYSAGIEAGAGIAGRIGWHRRKELLNEWVTYYPANLRPTLRPQRYQGDRNLLAPMDLAPSRHTYFSGKGEHPNSLIKRDLDGRPCWTIL